MKVITYLTFTLLSIVIQFCVMDLIQERIQMNEKGANNITSQKKQFSDVLKELSLNPHAIYYNNQKLVEVSNRSVSEVKNISLTQNNLETSTDFATTIFEELYNENISVTEDTFSTESIFTTETEQNFTDITPFPKSNETSIVKTNVSKNTINQCNCDLLYKVCDINCCCDYDCSDNELNMFRDCTTDNFYKEENECFLNIFHSNSDETNSLNNLLNFVKTNLPAKRNVNVEQYDAAAITVASDRSFKWHITAKSDKVAEFTRKPYTYGEPLWLLKHGSVYYIDMPSPVLNSYCSGRTMIKFLKEEHIKCIVNLRDIEMINIIKTTEETAIISVTEHSYNSSALNCSSLHCTNWTIIACDEVTCMAYNNSRHEPSCTENYCVNIALKISYVFYYYDSKVTKAIIKLYMQTISILVPFMIQEINIQFYLTNVTDDQIVTFSGNPGYIYGLPVVASYTRSNHSESFFNKTLDNKNYLLYPANKNGICFLSNSTNTIIMFGLNKRVKCKYIHHLNVINSTEVCKKLQNSINDLLGINSKIVVSPYGTPRNVVDEDWIPISFDKLQAEINGGLHENGSKLHCYNLITRISIIFVYVNIFDEVYKGQSKILHVKVDASVQNITSNIADVSTIITTDVTFIDVTKSPMYEYAGAPHLNIHLPQDFFFPLFSNTSLIQSNIHLVFYLCITLIINNK